jgi:putative DNA primase/helicase
MIKPKLHVVDEDTDDIAQLPEFSDDALALRFADQHADELRYVAVWAKWMHYNEKVWRPDDTLDSYDRARAICRDAAVRAGRNTTRFAATLASAKTVAAIERLARSDRRLAATINQWDADPWLLNTPGGVLDLQNGNSRPHQADDYATKTTSVSPSGDCPMFLNFLDRITDRNVELQYFIQRAFGYALTGTVREHALFFMHGRGANGKSVLLSTVAGILGNYQKTAPIETFTASSGDRHPTDLAGLQGARLVTAVETEEGRRWAESKIKTLTGGDPIAARFMRQDFFEYIPQFKLVIAGNHKPGLRSVDEAIRRRFHLIPFDVTIPEAERDPDLAEKLKVEWPGILRWMLNGCLEWQSLGLQPPSIVRDATDAYLEAEDAVAIWLDEACAREASACESSTKLFDSWKAWAERAGELVGSQKKLTQNLEARGFRVTHTKSGNAFVGIRILPVEAAEKWWNR